MAKQSDEEIAAALLRDTVISQREHDVWYDMTTKVYGEGFKVNIKHGMNSRALQRVSAFVRQLISNRRIQAALLNKPRDWSGHTVASGAHTRHTPDFTGDRRERVEWSWQAERMKAIGKLDRWSKKRR